MLMLTAKATAENLQKMAGVELDKTVAATAAGGGVIICICVRH
jgi:hypothetical protein